MKKMMISASLAILFSSLIFLPDTHATTEGCWDRIEHYLPNNNNILYNIAHQESDMLASEYASAEKCREKYSHPKSKKVKLVCATGQNLNHAESSNDFCEKFLGVNDNKVPYMQKKKIIRENFANSGCSFTYNNKQSAIVCAFLKDKDRNELNNFLKYNFWFFNVII